MKQRVYLYCSFGSPNISQRHTCSAARGCLIGCYAVRRCVDPKEPHFAGGFSFNYEDVQESLENLQKNITMNRKLFIPVSRDFYFQQYNTRIWFEGLEFVF